MDIQIYKNIVYTKTERECLTADVYLPAGKQDVPVVIMAHGGAFQAGAKEMYAAWGPYLAKNGIAAVSVNYRLATPNKPSYPGLLEDVEHAINFVVERAHEWNIEPTKMGIMGDSAGGYLAAMMAFADERASAKIKFVISAYGVFDIADWAAYTAATRTDFVVHKMFGQDPYTGKEVYENACPMHRIDHAVRSPLFSTAFLIIWGQDDDVVLPENQTIAFIKKLKQHKVHHETLAVPGHGHFWFTKNDALPDTEFTPLLKDDIAPKVLAFINTTLSGNSFSDPASKKEK